MPVKIIPVSLKNNPHQIVIGRRILEDLGSRLKLFKLGANPIIITHPIIRKFHGDKLLAGLKRGGFNSKIFEVPEGEESKSAKTVLALLEKIARYDQMKQIFILAFGGGVVGDLVGFLAAVYKRGVPYIQVPTTFLAQIDSAIGGKTAINLSVGKNLVGAFYQPGLIYCDTALLHTVSERQMRNGLAEAVKYGVIRDKKLFEYILKHYRKIIDRDPEILKTVIIRCAQIKTDVVLEDEKETKGVRTILNFGHTVGHAIEAAGKFRLYQHGEAIALGMRVAAKISCRLNLMPVKDTLLLNDLLTKIGLPKMIEKVSLADILTLMKHDKKFLKGKNRFVLTAGIGQVKIVENIPEEIIKKAIQTFLK